MLQVDLVLALKRCPVCKEKLLTKIYVTPRKQGYNAKYIKYCEEHGTIKIAWEKGA